jgi:hypothetical protein
VLLIGPGVAISRGRPAAASRFRTVHDEEAMKKSTGMITVEGYVDPCQWNEEEEVVAVQVATDDMREYLIEDSGKGAQLLDYVDEYVQVVGALSKKQGRYVLKVQRFEVLDAPELPDDYEDDEDYHR